jgi:copper chaperone CopZ
MSLLKNTKNYFAAAILITAVVACGNDKVNDQEQEEHVPVEINMKNLTVVDYGIEGMVCAMGCAATIQEEVINMPGVAVSEVDYEAVKAHFEFDSEIVSEDEIIAKIESIADEQYKVVEWVEPTKEEIEEHIETEEGNSEEESSEIEVSLPSFEIPNLFTLILDQI